MEKTDYAFPVELQKIMTPNPVTKDDVILGKKAVVRQDTGKTLGIVSDKYGLLKHADVIDAFRKSLSTVKHTENIRMSHEGAYMFANYALSDQTIEVKKGDIVSLQFIVKNSYNGANSLQIMLGAYRLVCENGMVIGKNFFNYSQRHIGAEKIDGNILSEKVGLLTEQFKEVLPHMQQMSRTKIVASGEQLFNKEVIPFPGYLLENASNVYEQDADYTQWGFYNALTNAITHDERNDNPFTNIHRGRVAWEIAQNVE